MKHRALAAAIVAPIGLAFAGLAGLAAGVEPHVRRGEQTPATATGRSLERYARGEFDAARDEILAGRTVQAIDREFRRESRDWIEQAPANERRRRIEVVAAVSVELADVSFSQHFDEYRIARELMEWACARLRSDAPTEEERRFFRASIALMQGARDENLLAGGLQDGRIFTGDESHALHASSRFPDEVRFEFALLTTRRETQWLAPGPLPSGFLVSGGRVIDFRDDVAKLDETTADFISFFDDPFIAHEARLRSGVLRFLRSQDAEAKADLIEAVNAEDLAVRHVAHLMLGVMADRAHELDEAERHYRAAHDAVAASASSVALASALYRIDRADEAAAVLQRFAALPPSPDPWRLYGQRDFRSYPSLRDAMREAIAPVRAMSPNAGAATGAGNSDANQAAASSAHITPQRPLDVTLVLQEHERALFTTPEKVESDLRKVAALLQPQDRLRVVFAGDDQRPLPFTADASLPNHTVPVETCRPIYDALGRALMQLEEPGRQHVVIVLSVGEGSGNVLTTDIVADLARRSRARVYVMAKEPFSSYSYRTVAALPACALTEMDWSRPRQEKLRYITANGRGSDWRDRELWLDGKRRLVAIAELTGGLEIHPPLISESIVGPVRDALDDARSRSGSGR